MPFGVLPPANPPDLRASGLLRPNRCDSSEHRFCLRSNSTAHNIAPDRPADKEAHAARIKNWPLTPFSAVSAWEAWEVSVPSVPLRPQRAAATVDNR